MIMKKRTFSSLQKQSEQLSTGPLNIQTSSKVKHVGDGRTNGGTDWRTDGRTELGKKSIIGDAPH